jgi:hypothetical protein
MSVRKRERKSPTGETKEAWVVNYTDAGGKRRLRTFKRKRELCRSPRGDELTRYRHWHAISRRDGFAATGPWPSKPIPPDTIEDVPALAAPPEAPTTPKPAPEPEPSRPEPTRTDRTDIARSVPAHASSPESPPAGNGRPRVKQRVEAFVREQLSNGPRHGDLVKRDAAEYAISERFLIAAASVSGCARGAGSGGCRARPERVRCFF